MQTSIASLSSRRPSRRELSRSRTKVNKRRRNKTSTRPFNWLKNSKQWTTTKYQSRSLNWNTRQVPKMEWQRRGLPNGMPRMVPTNFQKRLELTGVFCCSENWLHHFPCCCGVVPDSATPPMESARIQVIYTWESSFVWLFWSQDSFPSGRPSRVRLWWIPSRTSCPSRLLLSETVSKKWWTLISLS